MTEYSWENSYYNTPNYSKISKKSKYSNFIQKRIKEKLKTSNFYVDLSTERTIIIYDVESEDNGVVDIFVDFESFNNFLEWLDTE